MTIETILERIPTKTGSLNWQPSTLKIAPTVPPVCGEKQVFSTSQSVSKTILCYYLISYKTLFWDNMNIGTFYSPSERTNKNKKAN